TPPPEGGGAEMSDQQHDQDDDDDDPDDAGGSVAPAAAVWPGRQGAEQNQDQDDDEDRFHLILRAGVYRVQPVRGYRPDNAAARKVVPAGDRRNRSGASTLYKVHPDRITAAENGVVHDYARQGRPDSAEDQE